MIAGLLSPSEGSIRIDSSSTPDSRQQHLEVGFVFQQAALLPWRTVRDNVTLPLELGDRKRSVQKPGEAEILSVLQRVGLREADADKRPAELSGGMRMRVSLARAILTNPQILLLDEPLAAVDDILRIQLQNDLAGLHSERRLTSILVTHNLHEAVFLSDRVFVMSVRGAGEKGGAQMSGEIAVSRQHPRTAEFRRTNEFFQLTNQVSELLHAGGAM